MLLKNLKNLISFVQLRHIFSTYIYLLMYKIKDECILQGVGRICCYALTAQPDQTYVMKGVLFAARSLHGNLNAISPIVVLDQRSKS